MASRARPVGWIVNPTRRAVEAGQTWEAVGACRQPGNVAERARRAGGARYRTPRTEGRNRAWQRGGCVLVGAHLPQGTRVARGLAAIASICAGDAADGECRASRAVVPGRTRAAGAVVIGRRRICTALTNIPSGAGSRSVNGLGSPIAVEASRAQQAAGGQRRLSRRRAIPSGRTGKRNGSACQAIVANRTYVANNAVHRIRNGRPACAVISGCTGSGRLYQARGSTKHPGRAGSALRAEIKARNVRKRPRWAWMGCGHAGLGGAEVPRGTQLWRKGRRLRHGRRRQPQNK